MDTFSIAIDGPSGAGKSTIAKVVAERLGGMYLDTGAMYRTVGLYMKRIGVSLEDAAAIAARAEDVPLRVRHIDGVQHVFLGDEDVSEAIRQPDISLAASAVAAVPAVRARLVALQREIARTLSIVMDGRDIGTYVLPRATVKIYLTASAEKRAQRRVKQLAEKGIAEDYEQVLREIQQRDYQDSHRATTPLAQAADAVRVDTSELTLEQSIDAILAICRRAIDARKPDRHEEVCS